MPTSIPRPNEITLEVHVMSFISYAQNYEDVILYRVFKDIKNGTYIDVGANDPEVDSVTKLFYDLGWRGINIEPVESWFERLCQERPNDINLQIAVGDSEGEVDFYEIVGTGLSTLDKGIAERHARDSGYQVKCYKVPITRLSAVLEEHPLPEIHFLKIDVEGVEEQVLRGLDLEKARPWICIVESTLPNVQDESHQDWESILLGAGYEYSYFDGLNRFYVAKEHQELKRPISRPPNVFDDFNLSGKSNSPLHYQLAAVQASLTTAQEQNRALEATQTEAAARHSALQAQIEKALGNALMQDELLRDKEQRLQEATSSLEMSKQLLRDKESDLQEVTSGREEAERLLKDTERELREKDKAIRAMSDGLAKSLKQFKDIRDSVLLVEESLTRRDSLLHERRARLNKQQQRIQRLETEKENTAGHLHTLQGELDRVQGELDRVQGELDRVHSANVQWQLKAEDIASQLKAVYASKSWRVTLPLRWLWKPFDKNRAVTAPDSMELPHEDAQGEDVCSNAEQIPDGPARMEELRVNEILSRIRRES